MLMSEKMKNIPKLRFSEFVNSGEWKEEKLGELVTINSGGSPSSYDLKVTGKYPFLKVEDLNNCVKYQISSREYSNDTKNIIKKESIIFPKRGAAILLNKVRINISEVLMDTNLMAITPNNKIDYEFLYYTIDKVELSKIADTSTIPQINNKHITPFIIDIPKPKEQQKIADCLSSIDSIISAQYQKVELLKEHKKGLLQNLFPKDGENVPKLRFPEFINDGKWKKTTIGKIGSFYYGKSAPKWSLEENALTPCVRYGELYTKFGTIITETYSRTNIDPKNLKFSKGGEILVPRVGEKPEDFGKCCCYLPLENIAIGEMVSVFETSQNPLFYTYYFRNLYRKFANVVEGQNVKNLYYVELEPLEVYRPSLKEQQKIADCLTSIDEEINLQIQKVELLKKHKKALLQQLFPSNEVNK
jgi:restriction endonuclease S subunit